jgi:protein tyrosine/serine phosphatase
MHMKKRAAPFLALLLCTATASAADPAARPADWATPVEGTSIGNLYRVEKDLYRGSQPTAAGFRELQALGVRTVLDLAGGKGDAALAPGDSFKLVHIRMSAFGLRDDRVLEALRVMADPANRPLMVHCRQGADRTGAIVALYRVVVQGWSKQKALLEMKDGGYHHNELWLNMDYDVMKADVDALRRALGLTAPPPKP